jgi:hypothetical protein
MSRTLFVLSFLLGAAACGDHYSTQDAYEVCEDLTGRNPATNSPESFSDCVACFETCGDECDQLGSAPEQYVCPDEVDAAGEGGESGE